MAALSPVALLREAPDFARAIPASERQLAERVVVVPAFTAVGGALDVPPESPEPSLGLLVLDGLVIVNVVLGDRVASQLAGAGDIVDTAVPADALLPAAVSHVVADETRIAILDRGFIASVRRWPGLLLTLHQRLRQQERRLAVHAAIGKLRRVEDRVLALLWHLGEQWGRVATDGVIVPLGLTHETIGRLAGAERPTVSLALTELARTGEVTRRDDGSFVLANGSADRLRATTLPEQQLRPLAVGLLPLASGVAGEADASRARGETELQLLHRRLDALHDEMPERIDEMISLLEAEQASTVAGAKRRATRAG